MGKPNSPHTAQRAGAHARPPLSGTVSLLPENAENFLTSPRPAQYMSGLFECELSDKDSQVGI